MSGQRQEAERYARTIALVRAFLHDRPDDANTLLADAGPDEVITDLIRFALILVLTADEPADDILDRLSDQANAILERA